MLYEWIGVVGPSRQQECQPSRFSSALVYVFCFLSDLPCKLILCHEGLGKSFFGLLFLYAQCLQVIYNLPAQQPLVGKVDDRRVERFVKCHGTFDDIRVARHDGAVE